ncbi:MAG: cellulase family glycosylhydrolase [Prevotella sp.]|nr:cellulase family glycosylhydrolase [Prevotella sp.]
MTQKTFISALLAMCFCFAHAQGVFTTRETQLLDATGQPFIIVGMNNPHAWFGERAFQALDNIAATGANTVRIVWNTRGQAEELERIIQRCIALKMVPMVELHDVTGNSSAQRLLDMTGYYSRDDIKAVLMRHQRYLLINIANEWGEHSVTTQHWLQSYTAAVAAMRQTGFTTTLVIDAPGWGQNIQPILEGGNELMARDSLHNLLFSVHMYGSWNNAQDIIDKLTTAKEKGLPMIVGEFGYNSNDGQNNLKCKTDHRTIMTTCKQLGYGFIPWSWTGNNKENAWLDIVDSRDWKNPTWWGREVIDGECGIRKTAITAKVFEE